MTDRAIAAPADRPLPLPRAQTVVAWTLQLTSAAILAQTLFFKFTGAPEAVHIFTTLGVEPWGRIATGVLELVAAVLLLWPRLSVLGAGLALGLMGGAIASHLGPLGIEVQGDHGLLFTLALVVAGASAGVLALRRRQARTLGAWALATIKDRRA